MMSSSQPETTIVSAHSQAELLKTGAERPVARRVLTCPLCQGAVHHIPRRWIDRLLSIVMPVSRYRCATMRCQWEGNLRGKHPAHARVGRSYIGEGREPYL